MAHRATFGLADFARFHWRTTRPPACRPALATPHTFAALRFALPHSGPASVVVYDALGHLTRTLLVGELCAGEHACGWDGLDDRQATAPAGEYTLRLEVGNELVTARRVWIHVSV